MRPKLPENLSDLPEYDDRIIETLPTGETVIHRKVPEFEFFDWRSDDPIFFSDKDGSWAIDYHTKGGPYKRRIYV